jgi:hypothetical protein
MAMNNDIAQLVAGAEEMLNDAATDEVALELIPLLMRTDQVISRAKQINELRVARGRGLGKETRRLLQEIHDQLGRMAEVLEGEEQ